jgi:hypothetical protein
MDQTCAAVIADVKMKKFEPSLTSLTEIFIHISVQTMMLRLAKTVH